MSKKIARSSAGSACAHVADHLDEVRALQLLGGEDPAAAGLGQRVLELVDPVGGVDVDEDHADLGGGVLRQRPLGAVRAPDADPVALAETRGEHPAASRSTASLNSA